LRDEPHPDLLGETPRQAVGHVKDTSCLTCRAVLRWLADLGRDVKPEPVDRYSQDREAGAL
jgi:hypothetical protein